MSDLFFSYHENQLKRINEPKPGVFVAESYPVISRALSAEYVPLEFLVEKNTAENPEIRKLLQHYPDVPCEIAGQETMNRLRGYELTGGFLALLQRKPLPSLAEVLSGARRAVILEDVENPTNLGSMFRSAAALSIDAVLLTHGCSDPLYRRSARVSMGTVFQIPWTFLSDINEVKSLGFTLVGMALREPCLSLADPMLKKQKKLAILMGNEYNGLKDETIAACDSIVKIPMAHGVDSLNVSVAAALAFWELGSAAKNPHDSGEEDQ